MNFLSWYFQILFGINKIIMSCKFFQYLSVDKPNISLSMEPANETGKDVCIQSRVLSSSHGSSPLKPQVNSWLKTVVWDFKSPFRITWRKFKVWGSTWDWTWTLDTACSLFLKISLVTFNELQNFIAISCRCYIKTAKLSSNAVA